MRNLSRLKSTILWIVVPVIALCLAISPRSQAAAIQTGTFQLSGTVTDQSNQPIAGTTVTVTDPTTSNTIGSATTDANGNYSIPLPSGTYNITVTPPVNSGFQVATITNQAVTADTVVNFVLIPATPLTLSGHVLDELGNGVPNQQVEAVVNGTPIVNTVTDSAGAYSLNLNPGTYTLRIDSSNGSTTYNVPGNYYIDTQSFTLSQNTNLDIQVPARQVKVHVQDPNSQPVANVGLAASDARTGTLSLGTLTGSGYSYPSSTVFTDSVGNATLWLLPATYTVTATPPSGSPFSTIGVSDLIISTDTSITITLSQSLTLSGRVLDELGNGVPNQSVRANVNSNTIGQTVTDSAGAYSLSLSPGTYTLRIDGGGANVPSMYYIITESFTLSQNTSLDIKVPARQVKMHVQDLSGQPVANVGLAASDARTGTLSLGTLTGSGYSYPSSTVFTDSVGDATLWLLPATYTVTATPPFGSPFVITSVGDLTVTTDQSLNIILQNNTPTATPTPTSTATWGKSGLSATGACVKGVLVFTVTNNGGGPMASGTAWIVTDASGKTLGSGTTNRLAVGQSQQISITPPTRTTYPVTFIVNQEAGHPGTGKVKATVYSCVSVTATNTPTKTPSRSSVTTPNPQPTAGLGD